MKNHVRRYRQSKVKFTLTPPPPPYGNVCVTSCVLNGVNSCALAVKDTSKETITADAMIIRKNGLSELAGHWRLSGHLAMLG